MYLRKFQEVLRELQRDQRDEREREEQGQLRPETDLGGEEATQNLRGMRVTSPYTHVARSAAASSSRIEIVDDGL